MADIVFNIAKGRGGEFYQRVDLNDPANSAFIVVPVDVAAVTDATIRDFDTLAAILAGGVTERSTNNWNRKTITDSDIAAWVPDDVNDRADFDIPDQLWTPGPTSGVVTDLIIGFDSDTTSGTDASIVPVTMQDFPITPDGSEILAQINSAGFLRAA